MSFNFIHTADWQIGKPFGSFPDDVRVLLREARLDVVGRIAAVAKAASISHVLIAGDVFDSANPPIQVVTQLLGRLSAHKGVVWHLLPGNHDPAQSGGVWDVVKMRLPSEGVHLHLTAEPIEIAPHVVLLPAPLKAKALAHDPTAYMDGVEPNPVFCVLVLRMDLCRGLEAWGMLPCQLIHRGIAARSLIILRLVIGMDGRRFLTARGILVRLSLMATKTMIQDRC